MDSAAAFKCDDNEIKCTEAVCIGGSYVNIKGVYTGDQIFVKPHV